MVTPSVKRARNRDIALFSAGCAVAAITLLLAYGVSVGYQRVSSSPRYVGLGSVAYQAECDGGRDVTGADDRERACSALMRAVSQGDSSRVRAMLEAGVSPNSVSTLTWAPLHQAIRDRRWDIVGLLLDHGADPNANGTFCNVSPLDLAFQGQAPEPVKLLLMERGASVHVVHRDGQTLLMRLASYAPPGRCQILACGRWL